MSILRIIDGADKGIIPLTCSELFVRVADKTAADPNVHFTVEVSYIEVCTRSSLKNIGINLFDRSTMRRSGIY